MMKRIYEYEYLQAVVVDALPVHRNGVVLHGHPCRTSGTTTEARHAARFRPLRPVGGEPHECTKSLSPRGFGYCAECPPGPGREGGNHSAEWAQPAQSRWRTTL